MKIRLTQLSTGLKVEAELGKNGCLHKGLQSLFGHNFSFFIVDC